MPRRSNFVTRTTALLALTASTGDAFSPLGFNNIDMRVLQHQHPHLSPPGSPSRTFGLSHNMVLDPAMLEMVNNPALVDMLKSVNIEPAQVEYASEAVVEYLAELGFKDAGLAVVSAAAGAMTQMGKISDLSTELSKTKSDLIEAQKKLQAKMEEMNQKLFEMDREYEQSTANFKKEYDARMQKELKAITEKMKTDFKYALDIKLEREKSKLLAKYGVRKPNAANSEKDEFVTLKIEQARVQEANDKLNEALNHAKQELEKFKQEAQKRLTFPLNL